MTGSGGGSSDGRAGLVVVGAGPGGYAAAFLAADLGMDVALVDPEPEPGGVCLYRGCIPSKALLHVAALIDEAQRAVDWGVEFAEPRLRLSKLRRFKDEVVGTLTAGLGQLTRQRKIRYLRGRARLLDAHRVQITHQGRKTELAFDHAILATGSRPAMPASLALDSRRLLDSTSALELREIPRRMLVVGGGYIGLELGSVYAALGSRITLVEMLDGLLPGVDRDLVRPLQARLGGRFEEIALNTTVAQLKRQKNGIRVRLEGPEAGKSERIFDRVLVAVGRRPNSEGLGLERTRARVDEGGHVVVDATLRTEEDSLYAIGDLVGQPMLAHKASHEGRTAVRAIAGQKVAFEPAAIPAVVFTDPEIAWCGLTEGQAKQEGRTVAVARFPWAASGRARTLGRDDGLTKLVLETESGRVLGVGITGPGAGELIAEGVLAVEMAALAEDLALSIHPHPTLSETLMEAAEVFFGQATHLYRPRRRSGGA